MKHLLLCYTFSRMRQETEPGLPKHEFDAAVRETVTNRLRDLFEYAGALAQNEPTYHPHMHWITREPRFRTAVDMTEFTVDPHAPTSTERVRVMRPVVDPGLYGYDKSVSYWIEFSGPNEQPGQPVGDDHDQNGLYLEIGPDHDRFVWARPGRGADVLEHPTEVQLTRGNFLVMAQRLIEDNADRITPRYGTPPPQGLDRRVTT